MLLTSLNRSAGPNTKNGNPGRSPGTYPFRQSRSIHVETWGSNMSHSTLVIVSDHRERRREQQQS
jgi:hypothetical protein